MLTCSSCGKENPEGAKFCNECAAPLAEIAPPQALEERKIVSVLFCDLVGFTAASEQQDPEDVRARIRPYHARLRQEIERYDGTVEKFVGDAVMAVFGAPVAHEDDAERAVRAGLRILKAIEELNEADPELGLQVRVGINTGDALVALGARPEQGEGIVTGDVVNTAARIQTAAPVNGVAVAEQTYRATRRVFEYEPLAPVSLKGKAEPVSLWHPKAARFGRDVLRYETPFVGRDLEKPLLIGTFERAAQQRSLQLVTVVGEPGVGKSRLATELFAYVDAKPGLTRWRQGRCLPYGEGITFWALGEIVKAEAGILESDSAEVATAKLEVAVSPEEPERQWLLQRLAPLVGVEAGSPAERQELFTAWRRFFEGLASTNPTVLVFEDLHWADDALLAFLEYLAEWSQGVPLLVLCAARPELYERRPGWGAGLRNATTINLSPLSDRETAELVSHLVTGTMLGRELEGAILERAEGNPLYAEEFVRLLADRGLDALSEAAAPESVQALIAARLDTLSPDRKSLLQDAAVIGKVFWSGAVGEVGERDEGEVQLALHELARKELVRPARTSSMEGESEYSFWHLLVRDVAYSQIPRAERARRHVAIAGWLERKAGERVEDLAEVLTHHYLQALELVGAAGAAKEAAELELPTRPASSELRRRAVHFMVLAGDRALALDAARANALYRDALRLIPPHGPARLEVLAKVAQTAHLCGDFAEAADLFQQVIAGLPEDDLSLQRGRAMLDLAYVLWVRGSTARSRRVLAEAVDLLEAHPATPELAAAYAQRAADLFLGGQPRPALKWCARALDLASELGREEVAERAREIRGMSRCALGDWDGLDDLRDALRQSKRLDLAPATVRASINLATFLMLVDGPAEALRLYDEATELAERRGLTWLRMWLRAWPLEARFERGQWKQVLDDADEVLAWDQARGGSQLEVISLGAKAQTLACRGELAPAAALVEELLPKARAVGDPQILVPSIAVAALTHDLGGHPDQVVPLIEELDVFGEGGEWIRAIFLPVLGRALVAAGRLDLADKLLEGADDRTPRSRSAKLTTRAAVAEARGETAEALIAYTGAVESWTEHGVALEHGLALLGAGRCMMRLEREPEARIALLTARETFSDLGAVPFIERVDGVAAAEVESPARS